MQFFDLSRNKAIVLFILILLVFIPVLLGIIFYLSNYKTKETGFSTEYRTLKTKISSISTKNDLSENTDLLGALEKLKVLEDSKASPKSKYEALAVATLRLRSAYSNTNNPSFRPLINNDIANFAEKSFPEYYDESLFYASCQDKSCQESQAPSQLANILDEIEKSDFPEKVKETLSEDLINTSYRSNNEAYGKADQYMILAEMTEKNTWFSSSNANLKIATSIYTLVKQNYPKEYEEILNAINESKKNQK